MRDRPDLKSVSDDRLLRGLFEILKQTRHDEAELVAHISEVDARKLYAREAAPSMFAYWYGQMKADTFSGRQTHRGRNQRPRSLDGSQEGNRMS